MSVYQDELSVVIRIEQDDNGATREDWERALDMVYGSVPTSPQLEIITVRDPDGPTELSVYVDGVKTTEYVEESVDPGAGYDRQDWDDYTEAIASNEGYSPAFRAEYQELRDSYADSSYIT